MNLVFPSVVFVPMLIIQKYLMGVDDISSDRVQWCKKVNLAAITWSKVVYFAIREAPGGNVKVRVITAHAVAVVIDTLAALYLKSEGAFLELDMIG